MVKAGEQRIITLLNYLVNHNRDHSQELRELAEQVKGLTGGNVLQYVLEAAQLMDKSTESLKRALSELSKRDTASRNGPC